LVGKEGNVEGRKVVRNQRVGHVPVKYKVAGERCMRPLFQIHALSPDDVDVMFRLPPGKLQN